MIMVPSMRRPPSPPAGWRSIRPWNRLTLHVREITPVSATFILASSIALHTSDDSEGTDEFDHAGPSQRKLPLKASSMSELLGKGLAVNVNSTPWQRVVMHIDDDSDEEAIVILYGLHPSRQYDIELALVAGEETIRGNLTTDASSDMEDIGEEDLQGDVPILPSAQPQAITPAVTRPTTPVPLEPHRPLTVEERASQLLHELTALDEEKEALTARLKTARKDSQRADAALRSEIEALKRASERAAQTDNRSRQKILALQEATKQLLAASIEADEQVTLIESTLPQLEARAKAVDLEHRQAKEHAALSRARVDESIKTDKKQVAEREAEIAAISHRLEKLNARKDRLVEETVPELEEELGRLGREIEKAERPQQSPDDKIIAQIAPPFPSPASNQSFGISSPGSQLVTPGSSRPVNAPGRIDSLSISPPAHDHVGRPMLSSLLLATGISNSSPRSPRSPTAGNTRRTS